MFFQLHFAPIVLRRAAIVLIIAALAGCASRTRAPVEDRGTAPARPSQPPVVAPAAAPPPGAPAAEAAGPTYTVKPRDTLFQIALDSGLDYRELAAWNNIENVNLIRVGQVLRLNAPGETPVLATDQASPGVTTAPLRAPAPI